MSSPSPPPDPGAAREAIAREARAAGIEVPAHALDPLALHFHLLHTWNRRINLTAIRDPAEGIRRHVLEALEALEWLDELTGNGRGTPVPVLADLGSGNGYPALPLLAARPELRGRLWERVARKADFLRAVLRRTGMGGRVEVVERSFGGAFPETPAVVTLRAFPDPAETITRLLGKPVRAAGEAEAWSARRPSVLAWLSDRDARELSRRLADLPGIGTRIRPLRTRPGGSLFLAAPRAT